MQVVWFNEVGKEDVGLVGGKGANLGEMMSAKIPIPNGFIITAKAYFKFIDENNLQKKIHAALHDLDVENPIKLHSASKQVQNLILHGKMNQGLAELIIEYYEKLSSGDKMRSKQDGALRQSYPPRLGEAGSEASPFLHKIIKNIKPAEALVAVRSSATAEDLPDASFAGQQSTFLNIKGEAALLTAVKECWASLFEERAIYYRQTKKFDHFKVGIAVPVQKMVQAEKSGIIFTIDPINNDKKTIVIDAIFGLGELIVQGILTPDHYEIDKSTLKLVKKHISMQDKKLVKVGRENKIVKLSPHIGGKQKLTDREIKILAELGKKIEHHYFFPQDIEWAIDETGIYIVQSRPITAIENVKNRLEENEKLEKTLKRLPVLLRGTPASPGIAFGQVQIIKSAREIGKVETGEILVTEMTNPDFVPAMKKAVAIVTDKGGRTSHAAIVSRELGIPCVVGCEKATKALRNGLIITVDGEGGVIYKGAPSADVRSSKLEVGSRNGESYVKNNNIKTATKVYVNLAEPELAAEIAKRNVDGVGLLRAEFIMAQIGVHPRRMIEKGLRRNFVEILAENITKFCEAFNPRPVIYRATDFKTNEYANLRGGKKYEPREENPLIGYRGCYRYIKDAKVFEMEIDAVRRVRDKLGYKNLSMMIPFVRTVEEFHDVKKILIANGLTRAGSFDLYLMVEVPSNVILIDDFLNQGVDGVSIGSNDLTMLTLGVDRDNSQVAADYSELNPAVLWSLERVIKACVKKRVKCSICGQAPSVYPKLTEKLVEWGVTSVSVSPDMIEKTRLVIHEAECRIANRG